MIWWRRFARGHGPCGGQDNIRSVAWLEAGGRELGRVFTLGRSGTATELEWMIGEDRNRMLLRTEAVFSASDWEIDVRSEFELHPAADGLAALGVWKRNTAVTLPAGRISTRSGGRRGWAWCGPG